MTPEKDWSFKWLRVSYIKDKNIMYNAPNLFLSTVLGSKLNLVWRNPKCLEEAVNTALPFQTEPKHWPETFLVLVSCCMISTCSTFQPYRGTSSTGSAVYRKSRCWAPSYKWSRWHIRHIHLCRAFKYIIPVSAGAILRLLFSALHVQYQLWTYQQY